MQPLLRSALRLVDRISPPPKVHAHCDIPCGIYDPHLAQIAALTCVRMNQLLNDLEDPAVDGAMPSKEAREKFIHAVERYTAVKEEHAELCKREVRIIWGDYIKPEHVEKHKDLHNIVFNIMKLGSKVRQNVDLKASEDLLAEVQKFAEIFWQTKDAKTARVPSRQAVGGELVVPS